LLRTDDARLVLSRWAGRCADRLSPVTDDPPATPHFGGSDTVAAWSRGLGVESLYGGNSSRGVAGENETGARCR
jgi:hypothetical protein